VLTGSRRASRAAPVSGDLFQARILNDRRERRASADRERIGPALAIVRDESPDSHGLHRMRENAGRSQSRTPLELRRFEAEALWSKTASRSRPGRTFYALLVLPWTKP
jgi:hypothetical protein